MMFYEIAIKAASEASVFIAIVVAIYRIDFKSKNGREKDLIAIKGLTVLGVAFVVYMIVKLIMG